MFRSLGDLKEARTRLEESLTIYQEIGQRHDEANSWSELGWLDLDEGDLDAASTHLNSALNIFHELVVGRGIRSVQLGLGLLAYIRADRSRAMAIFEDVLTHVRRLDALLLLGSLQFEAKASEREIRSFRKAARHSFREAARYAKELYPYTEPISAAYLAALGEADPDSVEVPEAAAVAARARAHLVLHRAGASGDHLRRARVLLERMSTHLNGPALDAFWRNNQTARMLLEAESSSRLPG
jgi:tetratricopeptide (TPR) repeat protein